MAHKEESIGQFGGAPPGGPRRGGWRGGSMTLAARAFRAATGMTNDPIQQRATQKLACDRQALDQLMARSKGSITNHVYE